LLLTTINLMDVPATIVDSVLIEVLPRHNQALSLASERGIVAQLMRVNPIHPSWQQ
jgi:hypothetical protein